MPVLFPIHSSSETWPASSTNSLTEMIVPFYISDDRAFTIVHGDCFDVHPQFDFKFDMIFADPPYFLSNGGISYQAGKVVCVDKRECDKGGTPESIM